MELRATELPPSPAPQPRSPAARVPTTAYRLLSASDPSQNRERHVTAASARHLILTPLSQLGKGRSWPIIAASTSLPTKTQQTTDQPVLPITCHSSSLRTIWAIRSLIRSESPGSDRVCLACSLSGLSCWSIRRCNVVRPVSGNL